MLCTARYLKKFGELSKFCTIRFSHNKMQKVYLRRPADSDELHIHFHYENAKFRINRNFNLSRKINENIDFAINRIKNNIEKELQKRTKKSKRKNSAELSEQLPNLRNDEIEIHFRYSEEATILKDVTFAEMLDKLNDHLQLRLIDQTYDVVLNKPWIERLTLPACVLAGFMVYPSKIELQFAEREHCEGIWMKAPNPISGDIGNMNSWEECGRGLIYNTTNQDIGYYLKLTVAPGNASGEFGEPVHVITKQPIEAGPGVCPFEIRHRFTEHRLNGNSIRMLSYNILADLYADSDYSRTNLFPYCPTYALKIDYRKQLFLKEIIGYNSDIMCLQEVDMKIFDLDLKPILEGNSLKYCGRIAQKGTCGEGVATFYRTDRFEHISTHEVNIGESIPILPEFQQIWNRIRLNKKLIDRICDRGTTLQVTRLKHIESGRILLVCNTHLYFHPDADHIRLLQIGFCMVFVESLFKQTMVDLQLNNNEMLSIIFCGDFNSVPECGIYKLMTEGCVGDDFIDWSSNSEETVVNVRLEQPFEMQSACGTPKYTNYTHAFAACLDYIFFQKNRFEIKQVIPLPSEEELKADTAIPSVVFPSDHVALVADLEFK